MYDSLCLNQQGGFSEVKAIKHTGWINSPYWALLKCNRSRKEKETKVPELCIAVSDGINRGCIHSQLGKRSNAREERENRSKTKKLTMNIWTHFKVGSNWLNVLFYGDLTLWNPICWLNTSSLCLDVITSCFCRNYIKEMSHNLS